MVKKKGSTERAVLTVRETADALGIGINQTYEAIRSGEIRSLKIGKRSSSRAWPWKRSSQGLREGCAHDREQSPRAGDPRPPRRPTSSGIRSLTKRPRPCGRSRDTSPNSPTRQATRSTSIEAALTDDAGIAPEELEALAATLRKLRDDLTAYRLD